MSFITDSVYINNLYGLSHIFNETGHMPVSAGQIGIGVSDGTIAGTVADNFYLFPFGSPPINLTTAGQTLTFSNVGTGTGLVYESDVANLVKFRSLTAGAGMSITTVGDNIFLVATGGSAAGYEDLNTSAATDPNANLEITSVNANTGGLVTLTLGIPSPATPGTKKEIIISQLTAGSSLHLNVTSLINGSALLFNTLGMSTELIYTSVGWAISGSGAILLP